MIRFDSWGLPDGVTHLTINGAHISARINDKPTDVRHPDNIDWYDEKHVIVMNAVHELEKALACILSPFQK